MKAYFDFMEKTLKGYIDEKYGVDEVPGALKKIYASCLDISDKVRFSGYKPTKHDQERIAREVEKYLQSLIPEEDPVESIKLVN
jgi:hypothetical protein